MAETPFNRITRATRWQNKILFGMLLLAIFMAGILIWGLQKILEQQQGRLSLNFSALVASLNEQEAYLQALASESGALASLPRQVISRSTEESTQKQSNSRIYQGRESVGGMPFTLQCSLQIDCSSMPNELFLLGSYLAANYSSFWARSSFPATEAFFVKEGGAISLGVPAIGVSIGNESTSEESFIATVDLIKSHLRTQEVTWSKSFKAPDGATRVAWFNAPDTAEKIIGLVPVDFSRLVANESGPIKNDIYASVLFSRQRINAIVRTERPLPRHVFWLMHRDFGMLMGNGSPPEVGERGMDFTRNGLTLRIGEPSGEWTGYYKIDYTIFLDGSAWAPLGSIFLMAALSIFAGIAYNRRFNRIVVGPALDAQRSILESDEFNRTLIETAPVAICLISHGTGQIVFRNSLAQEWLRASGGYLQPVPGSNVEALKKVAHAQHPGMMEKIDVAHGKTLHLSYAPTRYMGQRVILCIFTDISARAEIERSLKSAKLAADEANAAKSSFLATMSHEIRTPLYGALGTLELLGMTDLTPMQRQYVERIDDSSTVLLQIISDVLDTSKIEAGQLQLESSPFSPRELVQSCTSSYAAMAQRKGLLLFSCVETHVPVSLIGDAVRIRQILGNLISNAIKFTDAGHVIIRVRRIDEDAAQARLTFEIADTGVGIAKSLHDQLFTPFFLVRNGSRTERGAGLGLSICWRLAQMMGSSIQVRSEPGLGSRFWFELVLKKDLESVEPTPDLQGSQVLVRTPHPELTENICAWLRHWGAKATAAGRVLAMAAPPDELLLDVQQPADFMEPRWQGRYLGVSTAGPASAHPEIDGHSVLSIGFGIVDLIGGRQRTAAVESSLAQFSLRVLIAEDNPINQVTLKGQLESLGCEVTVADDGAEALALWDIDPHDFVLTDVNMPYLNGYELTERLRSEGVTCPVVGVTANAMLDEETRCLEAGMNAWLVKPIQLRTLVHTLRKFAPAHALSHAAMADTVPMQLPAFEINVLKEHRVLFMQCMNDDVQALARGLDELRPDLTMHALHRMRGALLLAGLRDFAAETEILEKQIQSHGLGETVQNQLASLLSGLRDLLARL